MKQSVYLFKRRICAFFAMGTPDGEWEILAIETKSKLVGGPL